MNRSKAINIFISNKKCQKSLQHLTKHLEAYVGDENQRKAEKIVRGSNLEDKCSNYE